MNIASVLHFYFIFKSAVKFYTSWTKSLYKSGERYLPLFPIYTTSYQRKNKDSDFKQICFEENELIDLNFTNKCNSPQRLWLEFWFVDSLPPWFFRGSSLSLRTPTPQTGWSDFVRSNDWRPRSLVAQINKTSATSWSRCLATAYCHH